MKFNLNPYFKRLIFLSALISGFLFSSFFFLPCLAVADEFFEGILTFTLGSKGKETEMKYFMKGSKMRMQLELAPGVTSGGIADYEKKRMYILLPQGNLYTEIDIDEQSIQDNQQELAATDIQDTEETEKILGYDCQKIISKREGEITEIWIAKNFGKFYEPQLGAQSPMLATLQKRFETERAFPFRIVTYTPDKRELFRMEVSKVEKKDLEDDIFAIPAGYQKVSKAAGAR